MKTLSLLVPALLPLLCSCTTIPRADFRESVPVVAIVDVAPGYNRSLSLSIPDSKVIQLRIAQISQNPTAKWIPTAYIALKNDEADAIYILNLTTDTKLQKQYVRARVIDLGKKEELSSYRYQELFAVSSKNTLKIEISGKQIRSFINNKLVEERQLPFEPSYYEIGASSGSYELTVVEAPPPPAPE